MNLNFLFFFIDKIINNMNSKLIFKSKKDIEMKENVLNSFNSINNKLKYKMENKYDYPSTKWANMYLEYNRKLIRDGWTNKIPKHPRESDK